MSKGNGGNGVGWIAIPAELAVDLLRQRRFEDVGALVSLALTVKANIRAGEDPVPSARLQSTRWGWGWHRTRRFMQLVTPRVLAVLGRGTGEANGEANGDTLGIVVKGESHFAGEGNGEGNGEVVLDNKSQRLDYRGEGGGLLKTTVPSHSDTPPPDTQDQDQASEEKRSSRTVSVTPPTASLHAPGSSTPTATGWGEHSTPAPRTVPGSGPIPNDTQLLVQLLADQALSFTGRGIPPKYIEAVRAEVDTLLQEAGSYDRAEAAILDYFRDRRDRPKPRPPYYPGIGDDLRDAQARVKAGGNGTAGDRRRQADTAYARVGSQASFAAQEAPAQPEAPAPEAAVPEAPPEIPAEVLVIPAMKSIMARIGAEGREIPYHQHGEIRAGLQRLAENYTQEAVDRAALALARGSYLPGTPEAIIEALDARCAGGRG